MDFLLGATVATVVLLVILVPILIERHKYANHEKKCGAILRAFTQKRRYRYRELKDKVAEYLGKEWVNIDYDLYWLEEEGVIKSFYGPQETETLGGATYNTCPLFYKRVKEE